MKIIYIHIPKNAGTFVSLNLAQNFKPSEMYIIDQSTTFVDDFIADADRITDQYALISGHIPFRFVKPFVSKFDLIISSYREPWSRTWSFFCYVTSVSPEWAYLKPTGPDDLKEKFEFFVDAYFLANRNTRNHQCGFLGDKNIAAFAMENIETFNIKMLPCSNMVSNLRLLMESYGLTYRDDVHANISPEQHLYMNQGDNPSVDLKIRSWFDGDYELFEELRGKNAARTDIK